MHSKKNEMKRLLSLSLLLLLMPTMLFAQGKSIDEKIDGFFRPIADAVGSVIFYPISFGSHSVPIVLIVLIGGALFFTFYFNRAKRTFWLNL